MNLAETKAETAKAAESRLAVENRRIIEELARQGALVESVQRMEASLSAKNSEKEERLKEDVDRLSQQIENERRTGAVEVENLQNRIHEFETVRGLLEAKKDEAVAEALKAKKESLAAIKDQKELSSRCASLELEVKTAKQLVEETGTDAALRSTVSTLKEELATAQADLSKSKERESNYERLAKENEKALSDMTTAFQDLKKSRDVEEESLRKQIESAKKEGAAKHEMIVELTKDLSVHRDEQAKVVGELEKQLSMKESEFEAAKKDAEAASSRVEAAQLEMEKYRGEAHSAKVSAGVLCQRLLYVYLI